MVSIAASGCSPTTNNVSLAGTSSDTTGLPHFKLVNVIHGHVVQVCSNDAVVTEERPLSAPYSYSASANSTEVESVRWMEPHPTVDVPSEVHVGHRLDTIPGLSYLDDSGNTKRFLVPTLTVAAIDGQRTAGTPLPIPSDRYRYYKGPLGIYASDRKTGQFTQLFDQATDYNVSGRDDVLYVTTPQSDFPRKIIQVAVGQKPKQIFTGAICSIRNIAANGDLFIQDGKQYIRLDPKTGKTQVIPHAGYEVADFTWQGKSWNIGFRTDYDEKHRPKYSYMVAWNDKGETVDLMKLCPELVGKVESVKGMYTGKVMTNSNGLLAFELSGWNPNPAYVVGGPNRGDVTDRIYIYRTYVLKAVSEKSK